MKRKALTTWLSAIAVAVTCAPAIHADVYLQPWEFQSDMTVGRHGLTGAAVGGYVYSIGGVVTPASPGDAQNVVERYNPATDTWEPVAPMPTARHSLDSAVIETVKV